MHTTHRLADRSQAAAALQHVFRYFEFFDEHAHVPDIADFAYGNPRRMARCPRMLRRCSALQCRTIRAGSPTS